MKSGARKSSSPKKKKAASRPYSQTTKADAVVQDPDLAYSISSGVAGAFRWLGEASVRIFSEFDYILQGEKGVTRRSVESLARFLGISRKAMAEEVLDVSVKTLERKSATERFNKKISSHAIEIAKIMEHAYQVFGSEEKARHWFTTPNRALNNKQPYQLLDTFTGISMVNDVLVRIEEGVYA
ncbi:MAG: DUF2384 domain-containing protein [Chitinophagaceae bacterium]